MFHFLHTKLCECIGMFLLCFNAGLVAEFFGQNCSHTEAMDGLGISSGSH